MSRINTVPEITVDMIHAVLANGAQFEKTNNNGAYLRSHAAELILKHIRRGDLADGFTRRDVHRRCWAGLSDIESVTTSLDILVEHGWLKTETITTGGRPSIKYMINPSMINKKAVGKKKPERVLRSHAAELILKHIRCGDLADGFTRRNVYKNHWAGLSDIESVTGALDLLVEDGWILIDTVDKSRRSVSYRINPSMINKTAVGKKRPQRILEATEKKQAEEIADYKKNALERFTNNPTLRMIDLAHQCGVKFERLKNWLRRDKEFSEAIKQIRADYNETERERKEKEEEKKRKEREKQRYEYRKQYPIQHSKKTGQHASRYEWDEYVEYERPDGGLTREIIDNIKSPADGYKIVFDKEIEGINEKKILELRLGVRVFPCGHKEYIIVSIDDDEPLDKFAQRASGVPLTTYHPVRRGRKGFIVADIGDYSLEEARDAARRAALTTALQIAGIIDEAKYTESQKWNLQYLFKQLTGKKLDESIFADGKEKEHTVESFLAGLNNKQEEK